MVQPEEIEVKALKANIFLKKQPIKSREGVENIFLKILINL